MGIYFSGNDLFSAYRMRKKIFRESLSNTDEEINAYVVGNDGYYPSEE